MEANKNIDKNEAKESKSNKQKASSKLDTLRKRLQGILQDNLAIHGMTIEEFHNIMQEQGKSIFIQLTK
jgi:hypothetical protein